MAIYFVQSCCELVSTVVCDFAAFCCANALFRSVKLLPVFHDYLFVLFLFVFLVVLL